MWSCGSSGRDRWLATSSAGQPASSGWASDRPAGTRSGHRAGDRRGAGFSSGVIDHYFADKDDLLLQALAASHRRISARFPRVTRGLRGLAVVRALLADNFPIDSTRRDETRMEVQFWARSLGDEALLDVQRRETAGFRGQLGKHLDEAVADGELGGAVDPDDALERLLALMDGISVRAVIEPSRLPPARQLALLDDEVNRLRAPQG